MSEFNIDDLDEVIASADSSLVQMLALQLKKQIGISKASEQQLAAVVAENAGLKRFPDQIINFVGKLGTSEIGADTKEKIELAASRVKTPATDAYLAEVRAQGVDAAIERLIQKFEGTGHIGVPVMVLEHFAAQLRQGAAL